MKDKEKKIAQRIGEGAPLLVITDQLWAGGANHCMDS